MGPRKDKQASVTPIPEDQEEEEPSGEPSGDLALIRPFSIQSLSLVSGFFKEQANNLTTWMSARMDIRDAQMEARLDTKLKLQFTRIQQLFQQLSLQPNPQKPTPPFSSSAALPTINTTKSKTMKPEEVGFFDSEYEDTGPVVNAGKHIFYKNVYVFVDRLKDLATNKNDVKNVLTACLRGSALM